MRNVLHNTSRVLQHIILAVEGSFFYEIFIASPHIPIECFWFSIDRQTREKPYTLKINEEEKSLVL